MYEQLLAHVGHEIELVSYGEDANVAVQCIECGEVVVDADHPMAEPLR